LYLRAIFVAAFACHHLINSTIVEILFGIIFDATLITQLAHALINGIVIQSSPLSIWKSLNHALLRATLIFLTLSMLHPASFTAMILGHSLASLITVSIVISIQHLQGMEYKIIGSEVSLAIFL